MEAVQRYLNQLLRAQSFGGRTILRDEFTVVVYDTPNWGERESKAVRARFPDCEICVQAFDGSLSGFVVIVSRRAEPWGFASETAFVLACACLLWTAWWALGYLQRSAPAAAAI